MVGFLTTISDVAIHTFINLIEVIKTHRGKGLYEIPNSEFKE